MISKTFRGAGAHWRATPVTLALLIVSVSGQSQSRDSQWVQRLARECAAGERASCKRLVSTKQLVSEAYGIAETGPASLLHGLARAASDHSDAILFLRIGVRRFPADATFLYELGSRILDSGTVSAPTDTEAYGPLIQAVETKPDFFEALMQLGMLELRQGRPGVAESRFRAAARIHADLAAPRNWLGTALLQLGRPQEGADEFRAAVSLMGDDPEQHWRARIGLGEALFWLGDGEGALRSLREGEKDEAPGYGALKCAEAVTLRWLGRDDESDKACLDAVEGPMYCNCQGRRDVNGAAQVPFSRDEASVVVVALTQGAEVSSGSGANVIVDATTAFSDVGLPPVAAVRSRFLGLTHQYSDAQRVKEAVDDLLSRSRTTVPVDFSGVAPANIRSLSRREMQDLVLGVGASFYQRFPKAHGFVTVSRPGFSKDHHVAAVAVQLNRDIRNGAVHLFVLDRTGQAWTLRNRADTRR